MRAVPYAAWLLAVLVLAALAVSTFLALAATSDREEVVVDIAFAGAAGDDGRVEVSVEVTDYGRFDERHPVRLLGMVTGADEVDVASVEGDESVALELVGGQFLFPAEALSLEQLAEPATFGLELAGPEEGGPRELTVALVSGEPAPPEVGRLWGTQRYETAARVSEQTHPDGADTVYVARTFAFADVLAAASAAAAEGAPLLLAFEDSLPIDTRAEINRLAPSRVVLVGGGAALSDAVRGEVAELADTAERIAGADRYDTAARAALGTFEDASTVLIANGEDTDHALVAAAGAAAERAPVLFARRNELPDPTRRALGELAPERIIVLGGREVIGTPVFRQLHGHAGDVQRMAGDDLYETALEIAAASFDVDDVDAVVLASDLDFHDALIGGAAAAAFDAPLLLTTWDAVPDPVLEVLDTLALERLHLVGALSGDVIDTARAAATPETLTPDRARPLGEPASTTLGD